MIKYTGDQPEGFVTLASCDPVYLRKHVSALAASCMVYNNDLHMHMIMPSFEDIDFAHELQNKVQKQSNIKFTLSYENEPLNHMFYDNKRVYYACNRFIVAFHLFSHANAIFITDVDAMFMRHMYPLEKPIGLFLRESLPGTVGLEQEGTKVAAGALYADRSAAWFLSSIASKFDDIPNVWFKDQVAISRTFEATKDFLHYHTFDNDFMDWEDPNRCVLYTGKGNRKHTQKAYLELKTKYEQCLK